MLLCVCVCVCGVVSLPDPPKTPRGSWERVPADLSLRPFLGPHPILSLPTSTAKTGRQSQCHCLAKERRPGTQAGAPSSGRPAPLFLQRRNGSGARVPFSSHPGRILQTGL